MVNTAAFHARVRGSVPGLGGLKETKMFLPHPCEQMWPKNPFIHSFSHCLPVYTLYAYMHTNSSRILFIYIQLPWGRGGGYYPVRWRPTSALRV